MLTPVGRRVGAAALVLLVPLLGACGFGYQTDQIYQPGVGVNERSSSLDVLGALVVSGSEGQGTFVASLVNKDSDAEAQLISVASEQQQAQLSAPITIEPDTLVNLADTGAVSVTGDRVAEGNFVRLTLTFSNGQKLTVNAPVVSDQGDFAEVKTAKPATSPAP